jgi:hypothetical protein
MTNNKQQTAVEWLVNQMIENYHLTDESYYDFNQAKEMESRQSQRYATFCLRCINENLPIIRFKDWIKLEGGEQ